MNNTVSGNYLKSFSIVFALAALAALAAFVVDVPVSVTILIIVVAFISCAITQIVIHRTVVAPFLSQTNDAAEGRRTAEDSYALPALQSLVLGFQRGRTISDLLSAKTNSNAIAAAEVSFSADNLRAKLDVQVREIAQIADNSQNMTETVQQSADQASRAAELAKHAKDTCEQGQTSLEQALHKIDQLNEQSGETLQLIEQLNEKSNQIQSVTKVIEEIAEQTNLLALNAAIEAARAGDHGRGFAVVADEVRQLAARTAGATGEVETIVDEIQLETRQVVSRITTLSGNVEDSSRIMSEVSNQLGGISSQSAAVEEQISIIAGGASNNQDNLEMISASIQKIRSEIISSDDEVRVLANQASSLMEVAEISSAVLAEHTETNFHKSFYEAARRCADKISEVFENEIRSGSLSEADLFDRDYRPVDGTNPQKYSTRYDQYTDRALPPVQEAALNDNRDLVYAIVTDPNGYVPTHNNQFAHPPTGDYKTDLVKSRSKRLFNDRTGARCGCHTERMLLQTYKRDTGEIMHDLSVPIFVNGRHWGGFRVGYWPAKD
ncbi:methyl-accepting chemotaxis protein [Pontibacterium sp.]|uniref:methyl-accepting chemotaxis protein n=1 Tax=Pontibacterium sp. TaxID=2036026 RepID=UPI0035623954